MDTFSKFDGPDRHCWKSPMMMILFLTCLFRATSIRYSGSCCVSVCCTARYSMLWPIKKVLCPMFKKCALCTGSLCKSRWRTMSPISEKAENGRRRPSKTPEFQTCSIEQRPSRSDPSTAETFRLPRLPQQGLIRPTLRHPLAACTSTQPPCSHRQNKGLEEKERQRAGGCLDGITHKGKGTR